MRRINAAPRRYRNPSPRGSGQANAYLDALAARLERLAAQPMLGPERPELAEGVRSFPVESHIVYYLRDDFGIVVLRILHKRQDPHRHLV